MKAEHIAALIDLTSESSLRGYITIQHGSELNAALWELATKTDLREEVDAILQAKSLAEMDEALAVQSRS